MLSYALLLVFGCVICLSCLMGYWLGLKQSRIVYKLKQLEKKKAPEPEKPTVIMGTYQPPKPVGTATDNRSVGLVEAKTPERVEFETKQAIDKEALGR